MGRTFAEQKRLFVPRESQRREWPCTFHLPTCAEAGPQRAGKYFEANQVQHEVSSYLSPSPPLPPVVMEFLIHCLSLPPSPPRALTNIPNVGFSIKKKNKEPQHSIKVLHAFRETLGCR
jgi:hypothetical protein